MSNQDGPPSEQTKRPKSNWEATEPFYDFKFSSLAAICLSAALFFVGVMQVCVYLRQADIMAAQSEISRDQLSESKATQRAFIVVSELRIESTNEKDVNAPLRVTPVIKNTGPTPAIGVSLVVIKPANEASVAPSGVNQQEYARRSFYLGAPRDPDELLDAKDGRILTMSNFTIGPQGGVTASNLSTEMTDQAGMAAQTGAIGRFIYGSIHYADIFDAEHTTKFCFRIDGVFVDYKSKLNLTQHLCSNWNCTDKYCQKDKDNYESKLKTFIVNGPPW